MSQTLKSTLFFLLAALLMLAAVWYFPLHFGEVRGMGATRHCVAGMTSITLLQTSFGNDCGIVIDRMSIWPLQAVVGMLVALCIYGACTPREDHIRPCAFICIGVEILYAVVLSAYGLLASDQFMVSVMPSWGVVFPIASMVLFWAVVNLEIGSNDPDGLFGEEEEPE